MTILVTGSGGFIGRNLLPCLPQTEDVIPIDLSTGYDISKEGWSRSIPELSIDTIIHLAQSSRYRDFPEGNEDMFRVNVTGTFELLEWARTHHVKKFIFTSSGNVYRQAVGKLDETAAYECSTMYAATKIMAENLMQPYQPFFQQVVLRLFTVYGPGQNKMLIHNLIRRVQDGEEIYLADGIGLYLTPTYIKDVIGVITSLAAKNLPDKNYLFNVAGDEIISLADIVSEIGQQLKKHPNIRMTSDPVHSFCGDNSSLKKHYNNRFTPFKKGLREIIYNKNGINLE